jgi:hypothetical protein
MDTSTSHPPPKNNNQLHHPLAPPSSSTTMTADYNPNVTMVYDNESINLLDPNEKMMALAIAMAPRVGPATTTIATTMQL